MDMENEISHKHTLTHQYDATELSPDATENTAVITSADVHHAHVNGDKPHHHVSLDDMTNTKSADGKTPVKTEKKTDTDKVGLWQDDKP